MKLNFKKYGNNGDILIILHGLFGSLRNWHSFAKKLSTCYHVYNVDLRNHGRSPHSDEFNYQVMADDINELVMNERLHDITLTGHSMGGKVAMQYALDYPESLKKLVIIDASPIDYVDIPIDFLNFMSSTDLSNIHSRNEVEAALSAVITDDKMLKFLMGNLKRDENGKFEWILNISGIKKGFENIMKPVISDKQFDKPVLFIKGGKSNYIDINKLPQVRELFPQATISTIENSNHWVHVDVPEKLLDIINSYLRGIN